ncbi:hypothetical protein M6B38_345765 [Iris pallida]|uniref:Uncharacterized protein n=1 Tax=Iris pallida TaxID=29817 RepID=A0AAX6GUB0_IRIPA|nr:hypothetical protein M6B38_345765 [Iris pallida]
MALGELPLHPRLIDGQSTSISRRFQHTSRRSSLLGEVRLLGKENGWLPRVRLRRLLGSTPCPVHCRDNEGSMATAMTILSDRRRASERPTSSSSFR